MQYGGVRSGGGYILPAAKYDPDDDGGTIIFSIPDARSDVANLLRRSYRANDALPRTVTATAITHDRAVTGFSGLRFRIFLRNRPDKTLMCIPASV